MNFSAFGGFGGIHQFAAKFSHHDGNLQNGAFTPPVQDSHINRYHTTNTNHFNQNPNSVSNSTMQYSQNLYAQPQNEHNFLNNEQKSKNHAKIERDRNDDNIVNQQLLQNQSAWPSNSVEYSSHLLSATLPISIQHFLKYSETIKKESNPINAGGNLNLGMEANQFNLNKDVLNLKNGMGTNLNLALSNAATSVLNHGIDNNIIDSVATNNTSATTTTPATTTSTPAKAKKQKKKKPPKEKKVRPKPGEIRETKALDGSTLYCCPECQMAYPDRSLIEQHVISHAVERRFVCDICNAALKRKDHLTRHKLSHIPDRPHVCNICMKSFKRKEQLTLHIVIHSGEKKHICNECGKGFYRKDHLRKHTRSHIARRVKSEMSAQAATTAGTTANTTASVQSS